MPRRKATIVRTARPLAEPVYSFGDKLPIANSGQPDECGLAFAPLSVGDALDLAMPPFASGDAHYIGPSNDDVLGYAALPSWQYGYQPVGVGPGCGLLFNYGKEASPSNQSDQNAPSTMSTVSSYSNCPTLSPVNTDIISGADRQTVASMWSRGPSPLRHVTENTASDVVDMRGPLPELNTDTALRECLTAGETQTCSWAGCSSKFRTRDSLNWHVKADHLLICPVLGCCETGFKTKKLLDSHVRVAHNEDPTRREIEPKSFISLPRPTTNNNEDANVTPTASQPWDAVNDPAMRMTLSIATAKRKCREQLKGVLEKRQKKLVAGM
jgi:hypothetical protein